jgi:hypothetical protein
MTRFFRSIALFAALFLIELPPASAKEFSAEQKAALQITVDQFKAAIVALDMRGVVVAMPPRVLDLLTKEVNISLEQLVLQMDVGVKQTMAGIKILKFDMDVTGATTHDLPDGSSYLLVPTEAVMQLGESKMAAKAQTLAFQDSGGWYLVRVNEPEQVLILSKAYPVFKDVAFPKGSFEPVKE